MIKFLNQIFSSSLIITIPLFFFFTSIRVSFTALAQEEVNEVKIVYESVNPDSTIKYGIKRLLEKGQNFLTLAIFKNKRADYLINILDKRVSELSYVVEKEKKSSFEEASSRYVTFIGITNDEIHSFKGEDVQNLESILKKHMTIIKFLQSKYDYSSAEWRFLQQDFESAEVLLSKLNF